MSSLGFVPLSFKGRAFSLWNKGCFLEKYSAFHWDPPLNRLLPLGEHKRKVVFLLLVVTKRRENSHFLEFVALEDVGCSTVETVVNWFPCD